MMLFNIIVRIVKKYFNKGFKWYKFFETISGSTLILGLVHLIFKVSKNGDKLEAMVRFATLMTSI